MSSRSKTAEVNLGLELAMRHATPGMRMTRKDIASFCGCRVSAIEQMEQKALHKLYDRLKQLVGEHYS